MEPDPSVHFYKVPSERNSDFRIIWQCGVGVRIVTSKNYIVRQAVILLEYAKTIKDPKISAALIDKAAASAPA